METLQPVPTSGARINFSIVTVTFARDMMVRASIARAREIIGARTDVEYILVDNNPDHVDRSDMLAGLLHGRYLKLGVNKGVPARNDGACIAQGEIILFVDDDAILHPLDALDRYKAAFETDPLLAIVSARHVDLATGRTPREAFPHTDKSKAQDKPFRTFRFQGNGFAMRRSAYRSVGPMSDEFFYGLEEIDYAYRVINAGFTIRYDPSVWVVEHNDPGGRAPNRSVEESRLTNKLIISFKHMPWWCLPANVVLFTAYVFVLNRGRLNVFRSVAGFLAWMRHAQKWRTPISSEAQHYIRSCGGQVWR